MDRILCHICVFIMVSCLFVSGIIRLCVDYQRECRWLLVQIISVFCPRRNTVIFQRNSNIGGLSILEMNSGVSIQFLNCCFHAVYNGTSIVVDLVLPTNKNNSCCDHNV